LEIRRSHIQKMEVQRQRISALGEILAESLIQDRETAVRMSRMVGKIAPGSVCCHEGPRPRCFGDAGESGEPVQEGVRKRALNDEWGEWGVAVPRR
jgi:hypothetical protein